MGALLIASGAGMVLSGVGTLLAPGPMDGFNTSLRNPVAPRKVIYGRVRTGGTVINIAARGTQNTILDCVVAIASHPCALSLGGEGEAGLWPQLFFDQARISIDPAKALPGAVPGSGQSFSPGQTNNAQIKSITRSAMNSTNYTGGGLVTVVLSKAIPYLQSSDFVNVQGVNDDLTLNGRFLVVECLTTNGTTGYVTSFTYLNGGAPITISNQGNVSTTWADYKDQVVVEYLSGDQKLGETFKIMEATTSIIIDDGNGNETVTSNPWTKDCSLVGCTAAYIGLAYDPNASVLVFQQGIPQISFHVRGKNDIFDPRLGPQFLSDGSINPTSHVYTENPVLCICDFLTTPMESWGFGYSYGVDIDLDMIVKQANLCDLQVPLPLPFTGTEPMWSCCGQFDCSMSRGEVLKNLLTSCAGRLTEVGGKIFLNVAWWDDNLVIPTVDLLNLSTGPQEWRVTCSPDQLINAVRGTFISTFNSYQVSDFPYFALDGIHGYDPGNLIPQYGGDILIAQDAGHERRFAGIQLPFCVSVWQAQRSAKIELMRKRFYGTGVFKLNMGAYIYEPFDICAASFAFFGWFGKILEINNTRLTCTKQTNKNSDDVTLLGVELDFCETDSSIYQFSTEEYLSPEGATMGNWGVANFNENATPFPWSPGYANPLPGDAIGGPATFGLQTVYGVDAAGNASTTIQIKGTPPITPDLNLSAPELEATASSKPGSMRAGWYGVALSAFNNGEDNHGYTQFLDIIDVYIPADGGAVDYTAIWGSGDDGGALFLAYTGATTGATSVAYVWHFQCTVEPGGDQNTSGTITTFNESTPGGPDVCWNNFEVSWSEIIHAGDWADTVHSLTANSITIGGSGMLSNEWAGHTLSLYARAQFQNGLAPDVTTNPELLVVNMPVESSTASSGGLFTMTIGKNKAGVQLPDLTTLINVNDVVVMRMNPIFTANGFSDAQIKNGYYLAGDTDSAVGDLAVVISGLDYGDVCPIASSTGTSYTLSKPWAVMPSPGDIVIIVAPSQRPTWSSPKITILNQLAGPSTVSEPQLENLPYKQYLLTVRTVSAAGKYMPDSDGAPMRDIYIAGSGGTRTVTESTKIVISDGTILADCSGGNITLTLPPFSTLGNKVFTIQKKDSSVHTCTVNTTLDGMGGQVDYLNGATSVVIASQWTDPLQIKIGGV